MAFDPGPVAGEGDMGNTTDADEVDAWRVLTLDMAAFLAAKDHELLDTEVEDNGAVWYFAKTKELVEDVMAFTQGDGISEPAKLLQTYMRMRREMFNLLDGRQTA